MFGKVLFAVSVTIGGSFGAGVAQADNIQNLGPYASDTLDQLQDWGYNVMLDGVGRDVRYLDDYQRWQCQVTGIHPVVSEPLKAGESQTIYVDVSCPSSNNSPTDNTGTLAWIHRFGSGLKCVVTPKCPVVVEE